MQESHQHLANTAGSSHRWRATAERLMLALDLLEPELELEWAVRRSAHRAGGRGRKGPSPARASVREVYLMLVCHFPRAWSHPATVILTSLEPPER